MRLSIEQIASYTQATVQGAPDVLGYESCGVTWDSREVEQGFTYVALPGQRVDGHDFVRAAFESGAIAALVMQDPPEALKAYAITRGKALLCVSSTYDAFIALARAYRFMLKGRVIGITGSTGKTTTKNLVRDVLSARFSTIATKANQNNELGVPRTLLNADPDTEMVVVEMGMRGLGQLTSLCEFVKPDWGLINNVGESHIELLGSREHIAQAKAELVAALPKENGIAFLNGNDDKTDYIQHYADPSAKLNYVFFDGSGCVNGACGVKDMKNVSKALWAESIQLDGEGHPSFDMCAQGFDGADNVERQRCTLPLRGVHNVSNACSAAAVGHQAGMTLQEIVAALQNALPEGGRQEILQSSRGYTVINDAYNANPDSMRASLQLLKAIKTQGRRIAVLGDMGELGSFAQSCHESVGLLVAQADFDFVVCVGTLARFIARAAIAQGFAKDKLEVVATRDEALEIVKGYVAPNDVVLVKASHFMELDHVVKGLLD